MKQTTILIVLAAVLLNNMLVVAFAPTIAFTRHATNKDNTRYVSQNRVKPLHSDKFIFVVSGDDGEYEEEEEEDDDEELEVDPYTQIAKSEFQYAEEDSPSGSLMAMNGDLDATVMDWGGALGKLRERVDDVETGKSQNPSRALFRLMSAETPNQVIGKFVSQANPRTVTAMSAAVSSLLGGLTNPAMGMETLVKASGEKIGSLCFQLQMTGYMFRNAEYVLALKELMNLRGKATLEDYKEAFNRLDKDRSGYIDPAEIQDLFNDVYEGEAPSFEVDAFLKFFDQNNDGRISWNEFETGLGTAMATQLEKGDAAKRLLLVQDEIEEEEEDDTIDVPTTVSGVIEIEMEDGSVVEVEAKEYIENLKAEARALKEALQKEKSSGITSDEPANVIPNGMDEGAGSGDIASYIASRQGDVKSLTEGISPEIVDTMKMLVSFVLEGGDSGKGKKQLSEQEMAAMEMEVPGSALQQLALWQLVLGYRLREAEVTGEYMNLLQ